MGLTISDMHRSTYFNLRAKGLSHKSAINMFPKHLKSEVEKDVSKDFFSSHFGIPVWGFLIMVGVAILITLYFTL